MSILSRSVPSSLRTPVDISRFSQNLARPSSHAAADRKATLAQLASSRFASLPQEPEDARITGITRSLNRRLLALNLKGSLVQERLIA